MSEKPTVRCAPNGPYLVERCQMLKGIADGKVYDSEGTIALCRCGASENKPFCDGSHKRVGFTDKKAEDRTPDGRVDYAGAEITIHDNRGICAHAAFCTEGLKEVFKYGEEPWIDPDGAPVEKIVETIRSCPSGALSYTIDGIEHRDYDNAPVILIAPNGPYAVKGGADIEGVEWGEGTSREHFDLCRCGKSKNKPFCNGAHSEHPFE